jgi:hypothetical protein
MHPDESIEELLACRCMAKIALRLANPYGRVKHNAILEVPDCDFRPHKSMVPFVINEQ